MTTDDMLQSWEEGWVLRDEFNTLGDLERLLQDAKAKHGSTWKGRDPRVDLEAALRHLGRGGVIEDEGYNSYINAAARCIILAQRVKDSEGP